MDPRSAVADEFASNIMEVSFARPIRMTKPQEDQYSVDLAAAICRHLPKAPRNVLLERAEQARARLVAEAKTRAWPTIAEVIEAIRACGHSPRNGDPDAETEARMVAMVTDWYRKHGDAMPSCVTQSRTEAMVKAGVLTWEEARAACFPLPQAELDKILARNRRAPMPGLQPMPHGPGDFA